MARSRVTTYGVRGLMCARCLVSAVEELRQLPGVRSVGVDLVPNGESFVSIAPGGSASAEQVRAQLRHAGFEVVARRRARLHHAA